MPAELFTLSMSLPPTSVTIGNNVITTDDCTDELVTSLSALDLALGDLAVELLNAYSSRDTDSSQTRNVVDDIASTMNDSMHHMSKVLSSHFSKRVVSINDSSSTTYLKRHKAVKSAWNSLVSAGVLTPEQAASLQADLAQAVEGITMW